MEIQMIIPNPSGYSQYFGADGFDAFPDGNGYIWWGDNFKSTTQKGFFEFLVFRMKDGVIEQIALPEKVNGGGRLNWTPAGLFVSGSYQATENSPVEGRFFQITEFAPYIDGLPIIQTITIEKNIDQGARDLYNATLAKADSAINTANSAKSLAQNAYDNAKIAQNTAGTAQAAANNALNVANSKPTIDQVWAKINDRLFVLIQAINTGDRSDALNAAWMDILFKKVNDWIYGWMKDRGFIK
jgi:hypothetical protein